MRALFFGRKRKSLFFLLVVVSFGFIKFNFYTNITKADEKSSRIPLQKFPLVQEIANKHNMIRPIHRDGTMTMPLQRHVFPGDDVPSGNFIGLQNSNFAKIVNPPGHKPTILIWSPQFGSKIDYLANPTVCGGDIDCDITYDRSKLGESAALVFHYSGAGGVHSVPGVRDPKKLYIWWTLEKNHGSQLTEFDNIFNLTFTYRSDSGIYAPYGSTNLVLEEIRKAGDYDIERLLEKKRTSGKTGAWVVSNCGVRRRNDLVQAMIDNGIDIERFGRCYGSRKIGEGAYSESFYEALSHYKFYMSFENGYHCKDYMTEKFWFNGLRSGAVPVVLGAKKEDVMKVAPTKSFIHVDDFEDVPSLAKYLKYLSENETAYREYHEWRKWAHTSSYLVEDHLKLKNRDYDLRSFCKLCRVLQEEEEADRRALPRRKMVVPSLHAFWWKNENPECMHG